VPALIVQSQQPFVDPDARARLGPNWHHGQVVGAGHFVQVLVPDQVNGHCCVGRKWDTMPAPGAALW
jgi:hypothetical protein